MEPKKRIITCSDGTWNDTNTPSTNVRRIFNCIAGKGPDGVPQLKAYDEGVGTGYSILDKLVGGMTGAGLDKNIKDMYLFLCMTYRPKSDTKAEDDDIYLFGFSRGAYTARSLAGFIYNCGILKPENVHLIDTAYSLYRNRNKLTKPNGCMMQAFRDNYAFPRPRIKFVGVWDTVGSLGIPISFFRNRKRYRFHDCTLNEEVDHAYHALAIDERRSIFEPTLWEMSGEAREKGTQVLEQRWFPGVHSNVGGGYEDHRISDIALKWLMDKARDTGLHFEDPTNSTILTPLFNPDPKGKIYKSNGGIYRISPSRWRKVMDKINTFEVLDESVEYSLRKKMGKM
jgi:uncharacterized protein (DUF2235 family)